MIRAAGSAASEGELRGSAVRPPGDLYVVPVDVEVRAESPEGAVAIVRCLLSGAGVDVVAPPMRQADER